MELDEAIKHCEEVAEDNEAKALRIGQQDEGTLLDREAKECRRCAAEHRRLAGWLRELKDLKAFITGIYQILGEHFKYPCGNEAVAEIMKERSTCFDCGEHISNEECWRRYFTTMIGEKKENG